VNGTKTLHASPLGMATFSVLLGLTYVVEDVQDPAAFIFIIVPALSWAVWYGWEA
jgi:hypothetical protein